MREPVNEHVGQWLTAFYDGELSGERLEQVKTHLAGCPQCRSDLAELKSLTYLLRFDAAPKPRTSVERFTAQVMLRLPHAPERPASARVMTGIWKVAPLVAIAGWAFLQAALLVAQTVLVLYGQRIPAPSQGFLLSVLSNLNAWLGVLVPVLEIFVIEIVLTIFVVILLGGWLASWWAVKKV